MSTIWKTECIEEGKNNVTEVKTHFFFKLVRAQDLCDIRKEEDKPPKNKKDGFQRALHGSLITRNFTQKLMTANIHIYYVPDNILSTKSVQTSFNRFNSDNHSER